MPYRYHYDPNQPRIPAGQHGGGEWTRGVYQNREITHHVQFDPRIRAAQAAVEAVFAFFAWLSLRNNRNQRAIVSFKAREYHREGTDGFDVEDVRLLTREQVDGLCRRLQQVQIITDSADSAAKPLKGSMSPAQYGTLVHTLIQRQINGMGDPNFRAEVSPIKEIEEAQDYGSKGSIRVDVLEKRDQSTVCVYDIKTGRSGLSLARFGEIASSVFSAYGPVQRITSPR